MVRGGPFFGQAGRIAQDTLLAASRPPFTPPTWYAEAHSLGRLVALPSTRFWLPRTELPPDSSTAPGVKGREEGIRHSTWRNLEGKGSSTAHRGGDRGDGMGYISSGQESGHILVSPLPPPGKPCPPPLNHTPGLLSKCRNWRLKLSTALGLLKVPRRWPAHWAEGRGQGPGCRGGRKGGGRWGC